MTSPYIFYGADISLYSGKLRGYLRWKNVPFEARLAGREVYQNIIVPRVGYPIIPVVITPEDVCLQDTTQIIDYFEGRMPGPSVYPETPKQRLAALLLEVYGDEWLLLPAMHYRWAYNREWVLREFGAVQLPEGSAEAQRALGAKIAAPFAGSLPALGITPETVPAIEASYEALLTDLNAHFSAMPYLLGTRPSIGDYGLLGPLYAHLYRDPASGALMQRLAPAVCQWVERMHAPAQPLTGDFLPDDEVPETLLPILRRMMDEQLPALKQTIAAMATYKETHPEGPIPRAIGMHRFRLGAVEAERMIFPFNQWMFQRPLGFYRAGDKAALGSLLEACGGEDIKTLTIPAPLKRENFQLQWG